jgi:uncharacterized lipoprotein YddW (UPF0748 family)
MIVRGLVPILCALSACASAPRLQPGLGRCIWFDRWDYRSEGDIEVAFDRCQRAGFTAVVFQVRGNGTVCYPSAVESWSEHFGFHDPGFDPLAAAVRAAHTRGMQLHAWVNVAPGWIGTEEPGDARQLWQSRRGWFLTDAKAETPPRAAGRYLALNLCLPEVRAYVADLCREIVTRYDVDGLHLDYIRFPDPVPGVDGELGADAATLALFTAATGRPAGDVDALHAWQRQCVTRVVEAVRASTARGGRPCTLSAAVFADPVVARDRVRQDWPQWCAKRLVDCLVPMNYTDDDARFAELTRGAVRLAGGVPVVVAVGVYKHRDGAQTRRQLDAVLAGGGAGIGVFNYRSLYGISNEVPPDRQEELRAGVSGWLDANARCH